MSIVDKFKKLFGEEEEEISDLAREGAKEAIAFLLKAIEESDEEETFTFKRLPADGSEGIKIEQRYNGANVSVPFYAHAIMVNFARIAGIPFERLMSMVTTFHELLPEIVDTEQGAIDRGADDED